MITVTFSVNPYTTKHCDRIDTLDEHENKHVQDLLEWCDSLDRLFPSEGFTSVSECVSAQGNFVNKIRGLFREYQIGSTLRHDKCR